MVSELEVMVLSIISFVRKTCSVVLCPFLYAACVCGISLSIRLPTLSIKQTARIFRSIDNRIIGSRFCGGPIVFPGFRIAQSIPSPGLFLLDTLVADISL